MNSKQKGNRGERELVKILEKRFGKGKFKRTPSSGAYVGGANRKLNEDLPWEAKITLVSDIITPANFVFIMEHKYYTEMNFWDLLSDKSDWNHWIEQVWEDSKFVEKVPLLIIKYNRHKRIALVLHKYFESVMDKKWSHEEVNIDIIKPLFYLADDFIWKGFSVVMLEDLLKLPDSFWFNPE